MKTTPAFTRESSSNFLPAYWESLITPCLSLLADDCQLSIIATQQATPLLLNSIYYQLTHLAQLPKIFDTLFSMPCLTQPISGINFHQMSLIRPQLAAFHQAFFNNDKSFWLILGVVAARTDIQPQRLQHLADWLAFLALHSSKQGLNLTQTSVNSFLQWLPYSLSDPKLLDSTLLESILIDSGIATRLFFQPTYNLTNTNIKAIPAQDFFAQHQSLLHTYHQSQPFGILPFTIIDNRQNPAPSVTQLSQPILTKHPPSSSNDIFIIKTPTKVSWRTRLQKHWMAFAAGLTALIIGGIGAIATNNKANPTTPAITNKTLAEIPHDVAIVRTDTNTTKTSTTGVSKHKPTKTTLPEKQSTDKSTNKLPLQKTKADISEKVKENKPSTSREKPTTAQAQKVTKDKKAKSITSTAKKSVKRSANSHPKNQD